MQKTNEPVVASLEVNTETRKRASRWVLLRASVLWSSVGISLGGYMLFCVWQEVGNLSFHPPASDMLIHGAFVLAVLSPYIVLFRLWGRTPDPTIRLEAEFTREHIVLTGRDLRCNVPWNAVVAAIRTSDAILLSMRYPFTGLLLEKGAVEKQESLLRSLFAEKGIPCLGKRTAIWQGSLDAKPPPLPPNQQQ